MYCKIHRICASPRDLRANAGIARAERTVGESGPIAADGAFKIRLPRAVPIVEPLIDAFDPIHIRPEAHVTFKVEREMRAESALDRYGINQMLKF